MKNKFSGADDIWLTRSGNIAVKRIDTYVDKKGIYHHHEKTKYYKGNKQNLSDVKRVYGKLSVK